MNAARQTQDQEYDVVIVGSGAAALTAGLATSVAGLKTIILEKTKWLGGTSAISAAGLWVPANHHAKAAGLNDSPDIALGYIRALAPPGWRETEDSMWQSLVKEAPHMLAFVESHSPVRCSLTAQSDPFLEVPGAMRRGRMVSPKPLRRSVAGRYGARLRPPMLPHIFSYQEYLELDPYHHPFIASLRLAPRILWRLVAGIRGMGTALIAGLLKGCLENGCRVEIEARATDLITNENGDVIGCELEQGGSMRRVYARRGVVLATGGFEWNSQLIAKHFPGPVDFIASPRGNEGDGHAMAERVGAAMAHMDQANISPALPINYDGQAQGMSLSFHQEANAIIVDSAGRRFVNEYRFNIGEILDEREPATGAPKHLPAWLIADARFLKRSPMVRWFSRYDKKWLILGASLAELANRIQVPAAALAETVERYNGFCAAGFDADFQRGTLNERGQKSGDVASIALAPFVAMPINRSFISTKGGPRTNDKGEVLRGDGQSISGLYCAGVAMASPIGTWAVGAGTTLGPCMTWGYICGQTIAVSKARVISGKG